MKTETKEIPKICLSRFSKTKRMKRFKIFARPLNVCCSLLDRWKKQIVNVKSKSKRGNAELCKINKNQLLAEQNSQKLF